MGYISHPKVLSSWIRGFFHTIQSEVIYRLMCYEACIYRLLLISMMQSIFVFMFITVNKTWYNHSVNAYVVSFIIYICPGCINTSIFHGDSEVINKKVGNIYWFSQGAIFINSHTILWVLFILKVISTKQTINKGACFYVVGNSQIIIVFTHITVRMEVNSQMQVIF